jgi:GR25 family glycosyltransferase involved in LPS biosynthesis
MNFKELFSRTYIINIPEHQQRLEDTKKELAKIGLNDYTIFNGIKVNDGKTLQDREIGCKLSHLAIIEECKRDNIERVLIFEDDIQISDIFLDKLEKVKDFILNEKWDLFYLGGNFNINSGKHTERINDDIVRVSCCYTTHAYCVSKNAYEQILSFKGNMSSPYDVILSLIQQTRKKSYCLYPRQIFQREGVSYIMGRHLNYDIVLKDK